MKIPLPILHSLSHLYTVACTLFVSWSRNIWISVWLLRRSKVAVLFDSFPRPLQLRVAIFTFMSSVCFAMLLKNKETKTNKGAINVSKRKGIVILLPHSHFVSVAVSHDTGHIISLEEHFKQGVAEL